ncbi:MAG: ion channel [bacterium]|nr:ion channel [bacterium]
MTISKQPTHQQMRGRVIYLLTIAVLLNVLYPITEINTVFNVLYVASYALLLGFGTYVIAVNRTRLIATSAVALLTFVVNMIWVFNPASVPFTLGAYGLLVMFHLLMIVVLTDFIFTTQRVTREVLYAAITVYILIGDLFIPLFMVIETLTRTLQDTAAFIIASTPDVPITWQRMSFFSYITLTSTGYGDVLPVTTVAQAAAMLEAVIGVLYIAVLMARLVGLYAEDLSERKAQGREDE